MKCFCRLNSVADLLTNLSKFGETKWPEKNDLLGALKAIKHKSM